MSASRNLRRKASSALPNAAGLAEAAEALRILPDLVRRLGEANDLLQKGLSDISELRRELARQRKVFLWLLDPSDRHGFELEVREQGLRELYDRENPPEGS
jgi:hypothetical protein